MITTVEFRNSHHVAHLGILVSLGAEKWSTISHGDRELGTLLESLKPAKIGLRINQATTNSVGVSSD